MCILHIYPGFLRKPTFSSGFVFTKPTHICESGDLSYCFYVYCNIYLIQNCTTEHYKLAFYNIVNKITNNEITNKIDTLNFVTYIIHGKSTNNFFPCDT